ncbi:c-type cytochrome [Hymenobacter crusticola]|uniref:Cytochrome c class I n=1 Tax=Hymenobacter crusticola TaxID=1770526 RepID=A0A243WA02_9BACT|nr:cytochrome c [Hymenobacter crusticola]OUJ72272.1 cytochrome c class I [Hymenobacter crusticola]
MKLGPLQWVRAAAVLVAILLLAGCFTKRKDEGARLYAQRCASCHGEQGEGLRRLIPPLAGSDYLAQHRSSLPCQLRKGLAGEIVVNGVKYNQLMPGNESLTDSEITNLLNFVQTSWGNKGEVWTIREVADELQYCGGARGL